MTKKRLKPSFPCLITKKQIHVLEGHRKFLQTEIEKLINNLDITLGRAEVLSSEIEQLDSTIEEIKEIK